MSNNWKFRRSFASYQDIINNIKLYQEKNDDIYISNACTNAQEALELLFKGILDILDKSEAYPASGKDGHNTAALLNLVKKYSPIEVNINEKTERMMYNITDWETLGKYSQALNVKLETISTIKNSYLTIYNDFQKYFVSKNLL